MKEIQEILKNKVSNYEFQSLELDSAQGDGGISSFSFKPIDELKTPDKTKNLSLKKIKKERETAIENNFEISPLVKEHRGINQQEREETERRIEEIVNLRLSKIQEEAFQKGYEEGIETGKKEVYDQTRAMTEEKMAVLSEMISDLLRQKHELLDLEKKGVHTLIRNLTKWIILRELKDDGQYIERLLEKVLVELQTRSNILVQVNKNSFEGMDEVLETVKESLGQLKNVRVEIDYDMEGPGIMVESENGMIDGRLEQQFKNLDKLFESVGLSVSEEQPDLTQAFIQEPAGLESTPTDETDSEEPNE